MGLLQRLDQHGFLLDAEIDNIHKWFNKRPNCQVTLITSDSVLTELDAGLCECDTSAGAVTSTLPVAAGNEGLEFILKLVDATYNWTIASTDLIDGYASIVLIAENECATVRSNGTTWKMI